MKTICHLRSRCLALVLLTLVCGGAGLPVSAAPAREFYISPTGSDGNPGTRRKPFQTLARARDVVRTINRQMTGDIVVYLRGGTYPITAPVEFGPEDSGNNGFRVIYRAWKKEIPILSGGVLVTDWSLEREGVYQANLKWPGKLRSLYVNGVRADMAQADFKGQGAWGEFTVNGDEPWAETPGKTLDGIRFNSAEVPVFNNPDDVELVQHRIWNYLIVGVRDMAVESNHTIVKLQQPCGAMAATMAWNCNLAPTNIFTLRNARELLKRPGQFYFDRATHRLFYFARPGENMARATVVAPLSEGLIRITGISTNDRVKNLTFVGLTFSFDHWLLEQVGDSRGICGMQSLGLYTKFRADGNWHKDHYDLCELPGATVDLNNCQDIRFERNHFTHLASGCGISLGNDVVDSSVEGNVFQDLSGNAVNVGHPQHYLIGDGPRFKAGVEGVCARDTIKNNWIRKVCLDFKQGEAISGFFTEAVEISHNDIQGVPYGGIALGWWWGDSKIPASKVPKNNVIAGNRIVDTQQLLRGDGGGIYVLGEQPGGRIESNYVRSATRALYADDGSAYWVFRRNVVDTRKPGDEQGLDQDSKLNPWLHLWTDRIHDLVIDDNYTTITNVVNKGRNCEPTRLHVENPLSADAQAIIDSAGLETAYRDIAEIPATKSTK
jgi:hypothetical protein